jgi:hypothetical protein
VGKGIVEFYLSCSSMYLPTLNHKGGYMPIYTVRLWWHNNKTYEIEAKDGEHAVEKAMEECMDEECPDEITDSEVELSDDQYTDQQELLDRESPHEV